MEKNPQEILKELDEDFNSDCFRNYGIFTSYCMIGMCLILLVTPSLLFFHEKLSISNFFGVIFSIFVVIFSCSFLFYFYSSLKITKHLKNKYGDKSSKEIVKIFNETIDIDEIEKYYEKSSYLFKIELIEPRLEKEIKNKLNINKFCNLNILKNIKEESKVKITNI